MSFGPGNSYSKGSAFPITVDEDDEEGIPKIVNCYPEGSHLLPYVVEESNMLSLSHAMKTEKPPLQLRDMINALKDVAKAIASLHESGLIASSVTVNDIGIVINNGNEVCIHIGLPMFI
jgi:tRNA A-37 threonylcarbamoyl transferase component Bud32